MFKKYVLDALEATFLPKLTSKINQNVCLDEISDEFEFGSPGVKNLVTRSN